MAGWGFDLALNGLYSCTVAVGMGREMAARLRWRSRLFLVDEEERVMEFQGERFTELFVGIACVEFLPVI